MSIENNRNIFIGSTINLIDKRLILGDYFNSSSLVLLNVLIDSIEYCNKQYTATNKEEFLDKIKKLNRLVSNLKYQCPDICIYKDEIKNKSNFFNTNAKHFVSIGDCGNNQNPWTPVYLNVGEDFVPNTTILFLDEAKTITFVGSAVAPGQIYEYALAKRVGDTLVRIIGSTYSITNTGLINGEVNCS